MEIKVTRRLSFAGLEYIYEIHRRTTIGNPYYLCTLCDVGNIEAVVHATSKDHRILYFVSRKLYRWLGARLR